MYVIYGKTDSNVIDLSQSQTVSASTGYEILGNTDDALGTTDTGHGLADIGDVNTDGIDDLAVGGDGGYVVFGQSFPSNASNNTIDLADVTSSYIGYRINPPASGYTNASEVFAVGDLNADGENDLALSDPTANSDAGDVYVVYGKPDSSPVNLATLSAVGASSGGELGFHVPGVDSGDELGASVAGTTDATGDGNDDLIIGAPGASNSATNSGSTYVLSIADSSDDEGAQANVVRPSVAQPALKQTTAPKGYGLSFEEPCVWDANQCAVPNDQTATDDNLAVTYGTEGTEHGGVDPVDTLTKARSMQVFRLLVPYDAADTAHCGSGGYLNANSNCDGLNIGLFMKMVSEVQTNDNEPVAVDVTLKADGKYGAPGGSPRSAQTEYMNDLGYLATYINDTLAPNDGGIHVRYWGAWNEPDILNNVPYKTSKNPEYYAASYALWAHEELETHEDPSSHTLDIEPAVTSIPACAANETCSSTNPACTSNGACVVIAGEFARFEPDLGKPEGTKYPGSIQNYLYEMRMFQHADDYRPAIWSYHGYDDITSTGASGQTNGLSDTRAMLQLFGMGSSWIANGHEPQVWMTEGADSLQTGDAGPTPDSEAPPSAAMCNAAVAPNTTGITDGIQRFLALTSGKAPLSSGLSASDLNYAHKIGVAIYYEIAPGGSGPAGSPTNQPCGYPQDPLSATYLSTTTGEVMANTGQFDSSLFESAHQAELLGHAGVQPRLAYCLLADVPTSQDATECQGTSVADPEP